MKGGAGLAVSTAAGEAGGVRETRGGSALEQAGVQAPPLRRWPREAQRLGQPRPRSPAPLSSPADGGPCPCSRLALRPARASRGGSGGPQPPGRLREERGLDARSQPTLAFWISSLLPGDQRLVQPTCEPTGSGSRVSSFPAGQPLAHGQAAWGALGFSV